MATAVSKSESVETAGDVDLPRSPPKPMLRPPPAAVQAPRTSPPLPGRCFQYPARLIAIATPVALWAAQTRRVGALRPSIRIASDGRSGSIFRRRRSVSEVAASREIIPGPQMPRGRSRPMVRRGGSEPVSRSTSTTPFHGSSLPPPACRSFGPGALERRSRRAAGGRAAGIHRCPGPPPHSCRYP